MPSVFLPESVTSSVTGTSRFSPEFRPQKMCSPESFSPAVARRGIAPSVPRRHDPAKISPLHHTKLLNLFQYSSIEGKNCQASVVEKLPPFSNPCRLPGKTNRRRDHPDGRRGDKQKTRRKRHALAAGWCGRRDLNPHVYGETQAPQACLSTYSSTPACQVRGLLYSPACGLSTGNFPNCKNYAFLSRRGRGDSSRPM